jgi:hypothetical protein
MNSIIDFFKSIKVTPPTTKDSFTVEYAENFLVVVIKRPKGYTQTIRLILNEDFSVKGSTEDLSRDDRDNAIIKLRNVGFACSHIANMLGTTLSTPNNVLRARNGKQ